MAEKQKAIEHYVNHGECFTYTQSVLGYPCAHVFGDWLKALQPDAVRKQKNNNPAQTKPAITYDKKKKAVMALCLRQSSAASIATELDVSREILYQWKAQLLSREYTIDMPKKKPPHESEEHHQLQEQVKDLQQRMVQLQLEHDILKKANELLKKDQGVSHELLTNREKTKLIDALLDTHRLKALLNAVGLPRSAYFYHKARMKLPDKYAEDRLRIKEIFNSNWQCYGYRRMRVALRKSGQQLAEKVIRRLMKEGGLVAHSSCKRRRYNSYYGEISPPIDNIIKRNFQASAPNRKWLTDISEFRICAGKVYLSPIIDCFDGFVVSWKIGTRPTAQLVNSMLDDAIGSLHSKEHPIVHSDRGAHYRWPGWINSMRDAQLTRSMSRKGCSPDNAACEGFFGRLKTEFFYPGDWSQSTVEEFMTEMDR